MNLAKLSKEQFSGIIAFTGKMNLHRLPYKKLMLFLRNGTGKSSIVDAWEWLINFEIKDLQKENVSTSDYPHRLCNGDGCSIKVDFNHPTIQSVSATFNKRKITTPTTASLK